MGDKEKFEQVLEVKKSFEEAMEEILSGKRKPDLIVCSPAGWAMVDKSWKPN